MLRRKLLVAAFLLQFVTIGFGQEYLVQRMGDMFSVTSSRSNIVNNRIMFSAIGANGKDLFRTDGFRVTEFNLNGDEDSNPEGLFPFRGGMLFAASVSDERRRLLWMDSNDNIVPLTDDGNESILVSGLTQVGELVYFAMQFGDSANDIYSISSTAQISRVLSAEEEGLSPASFIIEAPYGNDSLCVSGKRHGETVQWMIHSGSQQIEPNIGWHCGPYRNTRFLYSIGETNLNEFYLVEDDSILPIDVIPTGVGGADFVAQSNTTVYFQMDETIYAYEAGESQPLGTGFTRATQRSELNDRVFFFTDTLDGEGSRLFSIFDNAIREIDFDPNRQDDVNPHSRAILDGWLYIVSNGDIYRTDGLQTELFLDSDLASIGGPLPHNGGLLYRTSTETENFGLDGERGFFWTDGVEQQFIDLSFRALPIGLPNLGEASFHFGQRSESESFGLYRILAADSLQRIDFNGNGAVDAADIDYLTSAILEAETAETLEFSGDQQIDLADRTAYIREFAGVDFGDANLDSSFDSGDLVLVFQAGRFETNEPAGWAQGDWNGDGRFTSQDFVAAFATGQYELGDNVRSVPEPPAFGWLIGTGLLALLGRRWGQGVKRR